MFLASAPYRARWKVLRPSGDFPEDFSQHVDRIAALWASGELTLPGVPRLVEESGNNGP